MVQVPHDCSKSEKAPSGPDEHRQVLNWEILEDSNESNQPAMMNSLAKRQ